MMPKLLSISWIFSFFILLGLFTRQSYASAPPGIVECQLEGIRILVSDIQAVLAHSQQEMKALLQKPAVQAVIEKACDEYGPCKSHADYHDELEKMMIDVRKQLKDFSFGKLTGICKDKANYANYVTALTATGNNAPTAPVANDFPDK